MSTVLTDGAKKELLDLAKRMGGVSLEDAMERLGLAKTTLRQHLLQLEEQGLIRRSYQKVGQGRPKLVFELSPSGQSLYPNRDSELLTGLIAFLQKSGSDDDLRRFFEQYWAGRKQQFERILASLPRRDRGDRELRRDALGKLLESEGFMPEIRKGRDQRITVRECNCPFSGAIRATHLPCRLESEFIEWALSAPITRTGYIPAGEHACTYVERGA